MPSIDVAAADLWPAITDLITQSREQIVRDGVLVGEVDIASLWDQLSTATGRAGGSGSAAPGSRPPLSIEAAVLVHDIQRTVVAALKASNRKVIAARRALIPADSPACPVPPRDPSGHVPTDLRRLNARYRRDPLRAATLASDIRGWISKIRVVLQLDRPQASYLRLPCMVCGATMHPEAMATGEVVQQPALRLEWSGDHARATVCRACGDTRWPGDFLAIAAAAGLNNLTKEALA